MNSNLYKIFESNNFKYGKVPFIDCHLHTNWTDGKHSIQEMYNRAVSCGLEIILFSEHARESSEDWFLRFSEEIRNLPNLPCRALLGVEAKIKDFEGNLDISTATAEVCDLVMGSVHRFPGENGIVKGFGETDPNSVIEIEYKLSLGALENPMLDILGHPFGMSINRFHRTPSDTLFNELIKKAKECNKIFEINSRYHHNISDLIEMCCKENTMISLGSNAHDIDTVGQIIKLLQNSNL
jgi:putative hydrolase